MKWLERGSLFTKSTARFPPQQPCKTIELRHKLAGDLTCGFRIKGKIRSH